MQPIEAVKRRWRSLKDGRPGQRFQDEYERRHRDGGNPARRVLILIIGALVLAAGIFFLPAPGPGFVIVAIGGGLIAQESRAAARLLDFIELKVRAVIGWAFRQWKNASLAGQLGMTVMAIIITGIALFAAYWLFFG